MTYEELLKEAKNNAPQNTVAIEFNGKKTNYRFWTNERIKKCFKCGRGTISHFKRYVKDNKGDGIVFI